MEVYELYKKEKTLSEIKTTQIKNLLGDLKLNKKNLSDMKEENEDLRLKVVNLKEEDIDKKILNYTIEENRKLEYKIKMQKERHVRLGSEFKAEMEHFAQMEEENKTLKEKIQQLEKKENDESLILAGNILDEGWETTSEGTLEPEDPPFSNSIPKSSPNMDTSVEKILKLLLKKVNSKKTNPNPNIPNNEKNKDPNVNTKPTEPRVNADLQVSNKKQVCKFYLQQRCIFGYKCRNLHPDNIQQNGSSIPPWNPNSYPILSPQRNRRNGINPGFLHGYDNTTNYRGTQAGYWSQPPPIPLNQTRFSQMAEVNISDVAQFPMLH